AGSHLLGRRAGRPGIPRPPQPPGPRRLRPPAGRRAPARAASRAHGALRHRRRAAAGRIATNLPPADPAPVAGPLAAAAAPVSSRVSRAITILSALMLAAFITLAMRLHAGEPRLGSVAEPERAPALVVGRTMDVETALTAAPAWEWRIYTSTLRDPGWEFDQASSWYAELAEYSLVPGVDLRLAILRGEAGRRESLERAVAEWPSRGEPLASYAEVIAAAYLDGDEVDS